MSMDLGDSCCLITVPSTFRFGIQMQSPGDNSSPSTTLCLLVIIKFHFHAVIPLFSSDVVIVRGLWLQLIMVTGDSSA